MSYRFLNRRPRPGPATVPPPPGPTASAARRRAGPRTVLCQLLICLTVTLGLSSRHLEGTASSLPFGTERSVALAVARPLHRLASAGGLDRADRAVASLLDRSASEEPGPDATHDDGGPPEAAAAASEPPETGGPAASAGVDTASTEAATTAPVADPSAGGDPGGAPAAEAARFGPPWPGSPVDTGTPAAVTQEAPAAAVAVAPSPGLGPAVVDPLVDAGPAAVAAQTRAVTPEARLRLWAGGDSLGEYVGNQLLAPLSDRSLAAVELDFHIGTGLTRPDTFDWEAHIDEVMARPDRPEALVFMVGGNDNQPMRAGGENLAVGSEPWLAEYRARVVDLMDSTRPPDAAAVSTHLWWIGLPPMRDGERDGLARSIDAIVAEEAAARPWVTFVDLMPRFSGPDGGFAGTITGPDGKAKVARAPDGIHITYAGSTWIAKDLWAEIVARWGL